MSDKKEKAIIVGTEQKGLFFGYVPEDTDIVALMHKDVFLLRSRACVRFTASIGGALGLGATGPDENCRVGPAVDHVVGPVTGVMLPTPAAIEAWEKAPWFGR